MNPALLLSLGLSPEQSRIYLSLIESGPQSAAALAKSAKVQRTYIYNLTRDLEKKNLLRTKKEGKTTLFVANSPDLLLSLAEAKKQEAKQTITLLESALPTLKSQYASIESKPVVRHFEGEAGIIKANLEVLAEKKEVLAYLVINESIDKKMTDFWQKYYHQRIANNIHVRAITPDTKAGIAYQSRDAQELRETRLVSKDKFPFAIEKNIVGNKVVFFSSKGNILIATIIENKEIADTERSIFELTWKQAGKLN